LNTLKSLGLGLTAALVLAACGTTTKLDEAKPAAAVPAASNTPAETAPVTQKAVDPLDDPNSPLAKRSVYFDYDNYTVKNDYKALITAHGNYLSQNKAKKIVIQGNADERGSSEYNLALGQKRAEAVRKALASMGVTESQMEAVSFGKEKPKATGHDEASWAENRRADIVYSAK
jgi:peptidoglycan-associated lipoprotein